MQFWKTDYFSFQTVWKSPFPDRNFRKHDKTIHFVQFFMTNKIFSLKYILHHFSTIFEVNLGSAVHHKKLYWKEHFPEKGFFAFLRKSKKFFCYSKTFLSFVSHRNNDSTTREIKILEFKIKKKSQRWCWFGNRLWRILKGFMANLKKQNISKTS